MCTLWMWYEWGFPSVYIHECVWLGANEIVLPVLCVCARPRIVCWACGGTYVYTGVCACTWRAWEFCSYSLWPHHGLWSQKTGSWTLCGARCPLLNSIIPTSDSVTQLSGSCTTEYTQAASVLCIRLQPQPESSWSLISVTDGSCEVRFRLRTLSLGSAVGGNLWRMSREGRLPLMASSRKPTVHK